MHTVINRHDNADFSEYVFIVDCLNDSADIRAEDVPSKTFNDEMKKRSNIVSVAEILFRWEFSNKLSEEALNFLLSSVLTVLN